MVTPLLTGMSDAARTELMARASEQGYVRCSELERFADASIHPTDIVDELVDEALSLGIEVIDDRDDDGAAPDDDAGSEDVGDGSGVGASGSGGAPLAQALPFTGLASDPVRQYLNEASRYELLEPEEEADLAKRYLAGRSAIDGDVRVWANGDPVDVALERVRRIGFHARDRLIRSNLRLVVPTARRYAGDDLPMSEALQEGNLGLMRAVERFDHTKGYRFSTYAVWWIRQAIQRALTSKGRTIRVPTSVWETSSKVRQVEGQLRVKLGRDPLDEEIAAAAKVSVERLHEVRDALRPLRSLDRPVGDDGDAAVGDLVADTRAIDPERLTTVADIRARIIAVLTGLPERDRAILELRYGLRDGEPRTLEEISQLVGLSRERVRRIEKGALEQLRDPAIEQGLETVLEALVA